MGLQNRLWPNKNIYDILTPFWALLDPTDGNFLKEKSLQPTDPYVPSIVPPVFHFVLPIWGLYNRLWPNKHIYGKTRRSVIIGANANYALPLYFFSSTSHWGLGTCSGPKWPPTAPPRTPWKKTILSKNGKILQNIFDKGNFFKKWIIAL